MLCANFLHEKQFLRKFINVHVLYKVGFTSELYKPVSIFQKPFLIMCLSNNKTVKTNQSLLSFIY